MDILKNIVWQEKYRPKKVKDVICPFTDEILQSMKNPKSIQNYIFYSRLGGTGKTSMAKAIVNDLECDALSLNASDERSIDTIRTKVKDFMITQSSNRNVKKCILMDEGEKLTSDAQDAIKNMMEEYSNNCFVILTTNNIYKIKEPLQTRFKIFEFVRPDKQKIFSYLKNICENEGLAYSDEGLQKIVDINYPSIRKMVVYLQGLYNQNKSAEIQNVFKQQMQYDNLWQMIKAYRWENIKKEILENGIDCMELNKYIFDIVIKGDVDLSKEIKLIQVLARNERDFKLGANQVIVFLASVPEMIKHLRENKNNEKNQ